jgi:hypothetical protein
LAQATSVHVPPLGVVLVRSPHVPLSPSAAKHSRARGSPLAVAVTLLNVIVPPAVVVTVVMA